jgi:hypothetical protein
MSDDRQDGQYKFSQLGLSRNLLRPRESLTKNNSRPLVQGHGSNLFTNRELFNVVEQKTQGNMASIAVPAARVRAYTQQDLIEGVEGIKDIITGKREVNGADEAELIYTILDRQSRTMDSIAGFFEMLRDVDPNRARTFRMKLIRQLNPHLPDKSIAILLTKTLSQEWKAAREAEEKERFKERGGAGAKLASLTDFNQKFSKWWRFFRSLKRKVETGFGNSSLYDLYKLKEGFYFESYLYLINSSEDAEKEFRQEMGNVYAQLKDENKAIFDILHGAADQDGAREVHVFFQSLGIAMNLMEVLTTFANILKLEGAQARSLCPDKKQFIVGHLTRIHEAAVEKSYDNISNFVSGFQPKYAVSQFRECDYSRRAIRIEYAAPIGGENVVFTISGVVDNLSELDCKIRKEAVGDSIVI